MLRLNNPVGHPQSFQKGERVGSIFTNMPQVAMLGRRKETLRYKTKRNESKRNL